MILPVVRSLFFNVPKYCILFEKYVKLLYICRRLNNILKTIKQHKPFLLLYGLLLLCGVFILLFFNKPEIILYLNQNNSIITDVLFTYITLLGEAPIVIFTLVLVLIKDRANFLKIALTLGVMGTLLYSFKFHIFEDNMRPRGFINNDALLHFIQGVEMHFKHSFPSGHTSTAFLCFFILSSYTRNKMVILLCLLLAAGVAYSRMYLGQHFFEDVFTGSIVGVVIGILGLSINFRIEKKSKA